ncbi:hypothetical protein HPB49_020343 [Dermacentor silvarum]|uniref:Uncharacterized protein n=1 Tax=Dermacentor silvarum TaxID=543639 RepID=A0ACB8CB84_DERSI|nr:hypothetical protein HPB49_020343 [Dermacentor silvarum]
MLLSPPAHNAHGTLKATLTRRVTAPENQRLQQLLREADIGDHTPSHLLRHMQQQLATTAGTVSTVYCSEKFFYRQFPSQTTSARTDRFWKR